MIATLKKAAGLLDYLKRHKKAAWVIIGLVVLNEIRGLIVVYAVVVAVLKSHGMDVL